MYLPNYIQGRAPIFPGNIPYIYFIFLKIFINPTYLPKYNLDEEILSAEYKIIKILSLIKWLSNVLYVLLFIYYIGGVKTYWKQLQSEIDFCDDALVCDDGHIGTHKFISSSFVI